ncbi:hypothetical protein GGR54DRAFT_654364 [Hypoxylon sp. NC1633]|nr:hypothetical protein GGR54DRAFT_654364 [Hypoxylon sp. NC1633]
MADPSPYRERDYGNEQAGPSQPRDRSKSPVDPQRQRGMMGMGGTPIARPAMAKFIDGRLRRIVCQFCNSRYTGAKAQCRRDYDGRGCRECRRYGLVCIYEGEVLPPYPEFVPPPPPAHCTPCANSGRVCDFKRPCDNCVATGTECVGPHRGCFHRGVAGDDMYGYYLTHHFGPRGVNDQPIPGVWTMPLDYHEEYLRWRTGQPLLHFPPPLPPPLQGPGVPTQPLAPAPPPPPPVTQPPAQLAPPPAQLAPPPAQPVAPPPAQPAPPPAQPAPPPAPPVGGSPAFIFEDLPAPVFGDLPAPIFDDPAPLMFDPAAPMFDLGGPIVDPATPMFDPAVMFNPGGPMDPAFLYGQPAPVDPAPMVQQPAPIVDPAAPMFQPPAPEVQPPAPMAKSPVPMLGTPPAPPPSPPPQYLVIQYQDMLNTVTQCVQSGIPMNLASVQERLSTDLQNSVPLDESIPARDVMIYLATRATDAHTTHNPFFAEVPVTVDVEIRGSYLESILLMNQCGRGDLNFVAPIRNVTQVPVDRPASPGPSRPSYWLPYNVRPEEVLVFPNDNMFPVGHPERVDMASVRRDPFMNHPDEAVESALATIPYNRIHEAGEMLPAHLIASCQVENRDGLVCGNPTQAGCEDTLHQGPGAPICDDHEMASRAGFRQAFMENGFIRQMRQYLCSACTNGAFPVFDVLAGKGVMVYYNANEDEQRRLAGPEGLASTSIVNTGMTMPVGGLRPMLELTGCSCGVKLFGRRICSPHRAQKMFNMALKCTAMRNYILSLYGRMVCPLCLARPGVDNYLFQGEDGGQNCPFRAWVCLQCHGYVFNGPENEIPTFHLDQLRNPGYPPPYGAHHDHQDVQMGDA